MSASTPAGAMSSAQNELQGASATALDIARARAELQSIKVQNRKTESDIDVNNVMKQVLAKDVQVKSATARQIGQSVQKGEFEAETSTAKAAVFKDLYKMFESGYSAAKRGDEYLSNKFFRKK